MSRASVKRATRASDLGKLMREAAGRRNLWDVFSDFCEMAACAVSNSVDFTNRAEREARYMERIARYEPAEQKLFSEMMAALVERMEAGPDDVLGKLFSELELYNADWGQFFTPYELCKTIAALQIGDPSRMAEAIETQGFVTVSEPVCGAGAMIIAFQELMREKGFNPQTQMHATCQDIDSRGVHMCYLHLSLLRIPAAVILGNTLAVECREVWYTPAHILGGWSRRLRMGRNPLIAAANDNQAPVVAEPVVAEPVASIETPIRPEAWQQSGLF